MLPGIVPKYFPFMLVAVVRCNKSFTSPLRWSNINSMAADFSTFTNRKTPSLTLRQKNNFFCWVYCKKSNSSALSSLWANGSCCLWQTLGKFYFTHRRVALLSFGFYWVYRSLFQSPAVFFTPCRSVLSYLTLNHRCTHTHTMTLQTHCKYIHLHRYVVLKGKVNGL